MAEPRDKGRTIFRTEKNADNPFVMIDRRPIENDKLSWKAKGILTYLISRPDNWTVRLRDLVNRSTDGVTAVRAALKELKDAGHLTRTEEREGGRFKQYILIVHEAPIKPHAGKPQAVKPQAENLTLNNTDINENDSRVKRIFEKTTQVTGTLPNAIDADLVGMWTEKHDDKWIEEALQITKKAGAKSLKYTDRILIGWEANGYPKPRDQRVKEARKNGNDKPTPATAYTDADLAIAASIKAERAAAMS